MEIYLDYIIENMTSGLIVIDLTGKITVFNRAAEEISKFKRELVIGRSYSEIFREDAESRNSLLYTLKYNNPVLNAESVIVSLNGEMIPIRFSTSLVKDNNGLLLGAMKIFHDLTEIKKLEDEIQQTRTLAALGEMAASIAHEIRNPLGGIGGGPEPVRGGLLCGYRQTVHT
ncbi:MAG: PAS domain S-box protein [candidate division KSB1 bacterium]|nr:PAS domain S-box protein [candidate division KSB1 bacterium]